jgi:hypothetical protein
MALVSAPNAHFYLAYLGRPLDDYGWYKASDMLDPKSRDFHAARFAFSPEYESLVPTGSVAEAIEMTYQRLFNRSAEPAGLAYWVGEVDARRLYSFELPMAILQGAQNADAESVSNKLAAAAAFGAALDTAFEKTYFTGNVSADAARAFIAGVGADAASLATALATVDAAVSAATAVGMPGGSGLTLTTGQDVIDGLTSTAYHVLTNAPDFISAPDGTLAQGDRIDALGGEDTLNIYGDGVFDTRTDLLLNVEAVFIQGGVQLVDLTGVRDLQRVSWSVYTDGTLRGLSSDTALEIVNLYAGEGVIEFSDRTAAGAQAATIALVNSQWGSVRVPDIEDVTILLDAGIGVFSITVPDAAHLTLTQGEGTEMRVQWINAPDASEVLVDGFGIVSVSAWSLPPGAQITVAGVSLVTRLPSGDINFTGGDGEERVVLGDVLLTSGRLQGGAGVDTLVVAHTDLITDANRALISGFEVLEVSGVGGSFDAGVLPNLQFAVGESTGVTVANAFPVTLVGHQHDGITLNTGESQTQTVVLDAAGYGPSLSAITVDDIRTDALKSLHIVSQGIEPTAYRLAHVVYLAGLASGSVDEIVIRGESSLTLDTYDLGRAFTIDGSAATGDLFLFVTGNSASVTTIGGSGEDLLRGAAFADTFTGGVGNDIFWMAAQHFTAATAETLAAAADTITDWAWGGDRIRYDTLLSLVDHTTATAGTARIVSGFATFDAADATLARKITAVEAGINSGAAAEAGQVAAFLHESDRYVFISNGVDGVNAGDALVRLAGVQSTAGLHIENGDLWGFPDMTV